MTGYIPSVVKKKKRNKWIVLFDYFSINRPLIMGKETC
jgi:hypothetical protein